MQNLEYIFRPRSVAVVGVSNNPLNIATRMFLNPLKELGFKGKIYPIHPKENKVAGLKAYPSVLDVPGPVDHVICAIKAHLTPKMMQDCAQKGVKTVHLFTSGFSETGEEEGIRLEREIVDIAHKGGVRVIGPNCVGLYCPSSGLSFEPDFPKEAGSVAFLSQSGGNSIELVQLGKIRGVRFSKVISYGNASDLNEADFMDYLANDPETKIITCYIEGVKKGRHFIQALSKATKSKPVIILKGGLTEAGTGAVASHTGSLAGSAKTWDALFQQLGIIQAHDLEDIIDLVLLFQSTNPPRGRRGAAVGVGGGFSVLASDNCEGEGLIVPSFPPQLRKELRTIVPEELDPGTSVRNPVDLSGSGWNADIFSRALTTIANFEGIDFLFVFTAVAFGLYRGTNIMVEQQTNTLIKVKKDIDKPIIMVARSSGGPEVASFVYDVEQKCLAAGVPVYPSTIRAARAMSRFIQYHEKKSTAEAGLVSNIM